MQGTETTVIFYTAATDNLKGKLIKNIYNTNTNMFTQEYFLLRNMKYLGILLTKDVKDFYTEN